MAKYGRSLLDRLSWSVHNTDRVRRIIAGLASRYIVMGNGYKLIIVLIVSDRFLFNVLPVSVLRVRLAPWHVLVYVSEDGRV